MTTDTTHAAAGPDAGEGERTFRFYSRVRHDLVGLGVVGVSVRVRGVSRSRRYGGWIAALANATAKALHADRFGAIPAADRRSLGVLLAQDDGTSADWKLRREAINDWLEEFDFGRFSTWSDFRAVRETFDDVCALDVTVAVGGTARLAVGWSRVDGDGRFVEHAVVDDAGRPAGPGSRNARTVDAVVEDVTLRHGIAGVIDHVVRVRIEGKSLRLTAENFADRLADAAVMDRAS